MSLPPEVVAKVAFGEGPVWCADGSVMCTSVAEGRFYRVWPDEQRAELFATTRGGANACAPTVDGGCIAVVDPTGTIVERLDMTSLEHGMVTNCCFGGTDGRALFATHSIPGTVVRWTGLPHPGRAIHPWPGFAAN